MNNETNFLSDRQSKTKRKSTLIHLFRFFRRVLKGIQIFGDFFSFLIVVQRHTQECGGGNLSAMGKPLTFGGLYLRNSANRDFRHVSGTHVT